MSSDPTLDRLIRWNRLFTVLGVLAFALAAFVITYGIVYAITDLLPRRKACQSLCESAGYANNKVTAQSCLCVDEVPVHQALGGGNQAIDR